MTKELSNGKIIQTIIAKLMEQNAKYEAEIAKLDIQVHDLNEEMAKLEAALQEIATITTDPEFGTPTIETAIKIANTALGENKDGLS